MDAVHKYSTWIPRHFLKFGINKKGILLIMWFVYILKCFDDSYYTGCTNNLGDRIARHGKGQVQYTKDKLPIELVGFIAFTDKYKAYKFERYLKSGSGMAFRNKRLI